jgi:predicted PurR-regulated permease PerM
VLELYFFAFDINFAVLWGLLTFFLGFIPYLGIILAAIPPIIVAWAKYGIQVAIAMTIFFAIINTIAESFIFPRKTARDFNFPFMLFLHHYSSGDGS